MLGELFSSSGNELYIRPAKEYIFPDEDLCFYEVSCIAGGAAPLGRRARSPALCPLQVMARCRQCREILIGWRCGEMPRAEINPPDKVKRRSFMAGDLLVLMGLGDIGRPEHV